MKKGKLIVISGPMYANKSQVTKLLFDKYCVFGKKGIWVKPDIDSRCPDQTVTHDNRPIAEALTISASQPDPWYGVLAEYDVVVFDEAQFFSKEILTLIEDLLTLNSRLAGPGPMRTVIVNGLKLTASDSIFGSMHYLLAMADEIISLKAVCNVCNKVDSATRTRSYNKNNPIVKVGGAGDYYVVCPECDGLDEKEKQPISD